MTSHQRLRPPADRQPGSWPARTSLLESPRPGLPGPYLSDPAVVDRQIPGNQTAGAAGTGSRLSTWLGRISKWPGQVPGGVELMVPRLGPATSRTAPARSQLLLTATRGDCVRGARSQPLSIRMPLIATQDAKARQILLPAILFPIRWTDARDDAFATRPAIPGVAGNRCMKGRTLQGITPRPQAPDDPFDGADGRLARSCYGQGNVVVRAAGKSLRIGAGVVPRKSIRHPKRLRNHGAVVISPSGRHVFVRMVRVEFIFHHGREPPIRRAGRQPPLAHQLRRQVAPLIRLPAVTVGPARRHTLAVGSSVGFPSATPMLLATAQALMTRARSRLAPASGTMMPTSKAMMPMTTSISISVKADLWHMLAPSGFGYWFPLVRGSSDR